MGPQKHFRTIYSDWAALRDLFFFPFKKQVLTCPSGKSGMLDSFRESKAFKILGRVLHPHLNILRNPRNIPKTARLSQVPGTVEFLI